MSSAEGPPVSLEKTVIDAALDSSILSLMLLGEDLYGSLLWYSLHLHNQKIVAKLDCPRTITLLYAVYVLQIAIEWFLIRRSLVDDGETRTSAFLAALSSPGWNTLLNDICSLFLSASQTDMAVLQRLESLLRAIALSSLLLLSEISLYLALIIIACVQKLNPDASAARTLNHLLSAALFMTLASTLLTTLLIAYRIYSVSRQNGLKSRRSFKNVMELIIQSAAAYALVSLLYAIEIVIPITNTNLVKIFPLESYTDVIFSFTAGVAPTVMVARVALSSGEDVDRTSNTRVSGLQFQAPSASVHDGTNRTDTIHVISSA
ncbi:hypothetical protein CPB84DRAFT_1851978 [Gymnopilus junonius]|uniref:Uncharacterized protein n=1 Tax=Gymnopilus junonius TaxID=109634 RepID=A0A9P5NEF3_GYMJU|nr:hypothetical protein CPB84DRAFT_1851978 [Gymnopilus junonius]